MNKIRNTAVLTVLMLFTAILAQAKPVKPRHMYMFGFSASFKDSTIYVTDIQDVQGAWMDNKTKFLLGRDNYSYQLKQHFTDKLQQPDRICIVFFATSRSKAEKQRQKLMRKYIPNPKRKKHYRKPYDIYYLTAADFKFEPIDMSPDEQQKQ